MTINQYFKMSSQENEEAEDGELVGISLVYNSYMRNKLEELPDKVCQAKFNEIYNCLWRKHSRTSVKVFGVFKSLLKKVLLEEVDELNQSFGIAEKLKTKTKIFSEYSDQTDVVHWRPNGNVEETLCSHDVEEMLKRKMLLEKLVNDKLKDIEQLKQQLEKNTSKIKKSEEKIDRAIVDYKRKLSHDTHSRYLETQIKREL